YRSALELMAGHLPALRGLRRIAERKNDAKAVLDCIRMEGEIVADGDRVLQLLLEAGEIYQDRFNDIARAVESFVQLLNRAPKHPKAFARLEAIYTAQQAWPALLELYSRRASAL